MTESTRVPSVSIVIPCRNEVKFISKCLDSIIASDFPHDNLEVLVVDGMSEDGTRTILNQYADQYPFLKILDNEKKITPSAFNIGIQHAHGDLVMIMSAHATYEKSAISKCVEFSKKFNADNIGGVWKVRSRGNTLIDRATAQALSHPFGVGDARYRTISETDTQPRWVDTAAFGCYKKEVFEKIGLFNEQLLHGQDMEFNVRLKKAGGKTLLVPEIVVNYYARSDFGSFLRHNFRNGAWAIIPFSYSTVFPVSWRHLIPLAFVSALTSSILLALIFPAGIWIGAGIIGSYLVTNLAASIYVSVKEKNPLCLMVMPIIFASLHLSYGFGSLWGLAKVVTGSLSKLQKKR